MTHARKLLGLTVLLLALGHSASAGAALKICNKTSSPASVAVGLIYSSLAITNGWYNLQPNECATWDQFDGTLEAQGQTTYYYYAHSSGGAWSGDMQMCVDMGNLNFSYARPPDNPTQNCGRGDTGAVKGFRRVNLKTKDAVLNLDQLY